MLRTCQSRVAFSKSKWYASAIKQVFKPIVLAQIRRSASAALVAPEEEEVVVVMEEENEGITQNNNNKAAAVSIPKDNYRRCEGFRIYDGGRCQRLVRIDPCQPTGPHFCYNHHPNPKPNIKRPNKEKHTELKRIPPTRLHSDDNTSLFKPPEKLFDCWTLWLGNRKKEVKESLLKEMLKPVSVNEKPGYIYVYSLHRGPRVSRKGHAYFKIGRTIDPHRRMYQLHNMCDHEPKIIELFPSFPQNEAAMMVTNLETIDEDKRIADFPKCPVPHRVEKLIHLELFGSFKKAAFKCSKCGKEHREWIKVNRTMHKEERRLLTDQELWLTRIRPVILKWIQYGVLASVMAKKSKSND